MTEPLVRVDRETMTTIRNLAAVNDMTLRDVVKAAVDHYDRHHTLQSTADAYRELQSQPDAWREYLREAREIGA